MGSSAPTMRVWLLFSCFLANCGARAVEEYDYDNIEPDITEEELIKILEEMEYVAPDDITEQDYSGISDLLDLITVDREENTIVEDTKVVEENDLDDEETEIVWIPAVVVEYDYEIMDSMDILEIFEDADTQLDYQEDQNYQLFVKKALDTTVKFETIYQEQRIFNIILLSGVSLICLIIMFGLISLAISIFNSSHTTNPTIPDGNVKLVKTHGIVKSYAKLPVEVKNMLPTNVAYKHLYEV